MKSKIFRTSFGPKELIVEFTDLVEQSDGSCIVRYGDTTILATAVMSKHAKEGADFFPLTVDFEEKFYATGKILGSRFQKREGRPTDDAVLSGRIVDRTIRPLFDSWIRNEVQVVLTVLSIGEDDPDVLAVIAASLAIGTSRIPWNGPVGAVRIGKTDQKEFSLNPSYIERSGEGYSLDLLCCGKEGNVNMIEVGANEVSEEIIVAGLAQATGELQKLEEFQKRVIAEMSVQKTVIAKPEPSEKTCALFEEYVRPILFEKVFSGRPGKTDLVELLEFWEKVFTENLPEEEHSLANELLQEKIDALLHAEAIENHRRPDGRGMDEVRPLFAKAGGLSSILHGSGLFYRGGTHVLSVLTLGAPGDAQLLDGMETQAEKRFMLHYNFPPYSVGETGRMGGMNRRMIGHGALAEKALVPVLPKKENFPYTIRLVAESMASNGSTSMASVCAGCLALMDGGVPISRPVAGIASGLMMNDQNYMVLTDIQGPEDHHGDMDFKVAGTEIGVTAVQMDVKVSGVPVAILSEAFEKAKAARLKILSVMKEEISSPRPTIAPSAPHIVCIRIKPDQIGLVIGTGGKTVKDIKEKTGAEIDIEDDGSVYLTGTGEACEAAKTAIEHLTWEPTVGERFRAEVVKITDFGAFVRVNGSTEGLIHISDIVPRRLAKVEELLHIGDIVPVVLKEVDDRGRLKFSIKDIDPEWFDKVK